MISDTPLFSLFTGRFNSSSRYFTIPSITRFAALSDFNNMRKSFAHRQYRWPLLSSPWSSSFAIFEQVHTANDDADKDPNAIRISLDCKAVVKIGSFSRGGKNRIEQKASDHDFEPTEKLVPFDIFIPELCESHFWFSIGPVTADFMVDRLEELWIKLNKRFPNLNRLVINADNGPESNGQRTQWLHRLVEFSDTAGIRIQLAYYPPYHSKYNPVERLWGVLENHWRGELLTSSDKALCLARTMTYRGIAPSTVRLVLKIYRKGVSLIKKQMVSIEKRIERLKDLEKWFITISPQLNSG